MRFSASSYCRYIESVVEDHEKALAGCHESYTRVYGGPILKPIVGTDNYNKDVLSLGHAEAYISFLIARTGSAERCW
jgi:hypothetical protein